MSELSQILDRIGTLEKNQREDIAALYEEIKKDRREMDAKLATDRALFLQEVKNLFAHGCSRAEKHDETAKKLDKQIADMERIRTLLDKGQGAIWAIGALVSVIGLVSGWLGSIMQRWNIHDAIPR